MQVLRYCPNTHVKMGWNEFIYNTVAVLRATGEMYALTHTTMVDARTRQLEPRHHQMCKRNGQGGSLPKS